MSTGRQDGRAIQDQMIKFELIEGLQRAIDNSYRRLRETARQEWESRFGGKDPSDACVSVRVTTVGSNAQVVCDSDFLTAPRRVNSKAEKTSAAVRALIWFEDRVSSSALPLL